MAEEAKAMSRQHQVWIMAALKDAPEMTASYEFLVRTGEEHHCDTLGALLKILKTRKVLAYKEQFLMYPMHKDEKITLINPEYDPMTDGK